MELEIIKTDDLVYNYTDDEHVGGSHWTTIIKEKEKLWIPVQDVLDLIDGGFGLNYQQYRKYLQEKLNVANIKDKK